jgi:hypothetical protein
MTTNLRALLSLISSGIDTIESTYAKNGVSFPSLDEPASQLQPDRAEGETMGDAAIVIAAAAQLIASVRGPVASLMDAASGVSCLHK